MEEDIISVCEPSEQYGQGYVKLHRELLEHRYFCNEKLLKFYIWCIMRANWTDKVIMVGNQTVELQRGQFVFGRKSAAEELDMSEQTVRTLLNILKADNKINQQTTNKYSVISVVNYDTWQTLDNQQQPANQPTNNQPVTTDKKVKKEKNKNTNGHFENSAVVFEKCWEEYPRKIGKENARRHFNAQVKSVEEARTLFASIQNYKTSVEGMEDRFIKHGSTFFNNVWRDYAE